MRLRLVKQGTNIDFFKRARLWLGISAVLMVVALASYLIQGLNFGIDFQGGTSIRTQSEAPIDVGAYRGAIEPLDLGDVSITEVFDPSFDDNQNVAMIRIQGPRGGGERHQRDHRSGARGAASAGVHNHIHRC